MSNNRRFISLAIFLLLFVICFRCSSQVENIVEITTRSDDFPIKYFSTKLEAKSVQLDSIANRTNQSYEPLTMGTLSDDKYGRVKAQLYTEFLPQSISTKIPENATYKSAVVKFYGQFINYIDKKALDITQNFKLYEMDSVMPTKNFYNNKLRVFIPGDGLKSSPITSFVFNANEAEKKYTDANKNVDSVYQIEVSLPVNFGEKLFNARKDKSSEYISSIADFKKKFKGLSVLPDDNNSLYVGFFHSKPTEDFGTDLSDPRSIVEITYITTENGSDKENTYKFYFDDIGGTAYKYTQYVSDRTNSSFSSVVIPTNYTAYNTDYIALEAKTGLGMKFLLNPLREYAKDSKNRRITRAHIKLSNLARLDNAQTLQFYALFTDNTNKKLFSNKNLKGIQYPTTTATEFKYVYTQNSTLVSYTLNSGNSTEIYLDLTIYLEAMVNDVLDNNEDIMLYPLVNSLPERFYLSKDDVKLEVFYVEKE